MDMFNETKKFMKSYEEIQEKISENLSKFDNHNMRLMTLMMLKRFSEINIESAYKNIKEKVGEEYADNLISECNKGISELEMQQTKI